MKEGREEGRREGWKGRREEEFKEKRRHNLYLVDTI